MITYDDFKKIELKTAKILKAERVEGSEKLIKLEVDCKDPLAVSEQEPLASLDQDKIDTGESVISKAALFTSRQIVAGIGLKYQPEDLIGKTIIIVSNLEPRKLMGLESQGMLLAASNDSEGPVLLTVLEDIAPGSEIR